jgi:hypothetical protein
MAGGPPSGGFGNSLTSILTNPTVEELLPAAAGAIGGALTGRKGDIKNQLGRGLEGGVGGLEQGTQEVIAQQNFKLAQQYRTAMINHVGLEDNLLTGKISAQQVQDKQIAAFNNLPPEEQAKWGNDPKQWAQGMRAISTKNADVPSKQMLVAQMLKSPTAGPYLSALGITKPGDIPTNAATLDKIITGYKYEPPDIQAQRTAETAAANARTAEARSTESRNAAQTAVEEARLHGTLPAAPENPDVAAQRKASTEHIKAETAAMPANQQIKNVNAIQKIRQNYDKEHPIAGTEKGRNLAVLKGGFDPETNKPLPGGSMAPTGKSAKRSDGTTLNNGLHKDKNGNVFYVMDGEIYAH